MKRVTHRGEKDHAPMRRQDYLFLSLRMIMLQLRHFPIIAAFIAGAFLGVTLNNWHGSSLRSSSFIIENDHRLAALKKVPPAVTRIELSTQQYSQYLQEYQTQIDGWFSREILYAIWILTRYQYDHLNVVGAIGEIGVHHGKFTCFLFLMRRYREQTLFAVDVFDNQALNKDGSGRGQKDLFLNNIRKYADVHRNEVALYAGSSLDLNPVFSADSPQVTWWKDAIVGERSIQLVSVRLERNKSKRPFLFFFF